MNQLLRKVRKKENQSAANGIVVYVCSGGHRTVTIDPVGRAKPLYIACRDGVCGLRARLCWYTAVTAPKLMPEWEWYSPTHAEPASI
ncbi:MAG: hypothetical protein ACREQ4_16245 [Candidatus Binataceae bacterium]